VLGEQQERVGQSAQLRPAGCGDRLELLDEQLQQRVVVRHPAAGLADQTQHAVDDDRFDGRFRLAARRSARPAGPHGAGA
jgi:hypothetical protein